MTPWKPPAITTLPVSATAYAVGVSMDTLGIGAVHIAIAPKPDALRFDAVDPEAAAARNPAWEAPAVLTLSVCAGSIR